MQYSNLDDLNQAINKCSKCELDARKLGFGKTIGQGATKDVRVLFICQKPHFIAESRIPLDTQKVLWEKYQQGGFFSTNLRFYFLLNEAGLLGRKQETQKTLNELRKVALKDDIERWWKVRADISRSLLETNGFYLTEALKCGTPNNRRPSIKEIRNCREFLLAEIAILNPKIVCCLGIDSIKSLVGTKIKLEWGKSYTIFGFRVFPTFFPGQYGSARLGIDDSLRVKHFRKLKRLTR